jgi:hypothetical protein
MLTALREVSKSRQQVDRAAAVDRAEQQPRSPGVVGVAQPAQQGRGGQGQHLVNKTAGQQYEYTWRASRQWLAHTQAGRVTGKISEHFGGSAKLFAWTASSAIESPPCGPSLTYLGHGGSCDVRQAVKRCVVGRLVHLHRPMTPKKNSNRTAWAARGRRFVAKTKSTN